MKLEIEIIKQTFFSNTYKEEVNYTLGCGIQSIDSLTFTDLEEISNTLNVYLNKTKKKKENK